MNKLKNILGFIIVISLLIFIAKRFTTLIFPIIIIAILFVTIASAMRMSVGELIQEIKSFLKRNKVK